MAVVMLLLLLHGADAGATCLVTDWLHLMMI
jgi:hypothetical protein